MNIEKIRHSLSHLMAAAVQELYPGTKFGIGPVIENGFYYDFDLPKPLTLDDLLKIEAKMKKIIEENLPFKKRKLPKTILVDVFKNQPYKLELIEEIVESESLLISIYQTKDFIDLCKGPHVKSTLQLHSGQAKEVPDAFKLTKIAGAYWQGDEKNKMLTRIYGVAFKTKKELNQYLFQQEESEKRDHRLLGQKLELFMFDEEVGRGLPIWLPNGTILRKIIEDYLYEELTEHGYQWLWTPHIGNLDLWKTSGHLDFYQENMYSPIKIDKEEYMIKPMNCPFHSKVYNSKIRSYKDLPVCLAELGTVYRYEKSGVLHGLTRVRGFTQDDAHIICMPEQITQEIVNLLKHGIQILKIFGFKDYIIYLSTRPEKYAGTLKDWQKTTNTLKYALKTLKLKYQTDSGGGIFYGPKIDIKIKDSLSREWQCTTIQFDFNLPERFRMTYIDKKNKKKKPYMIHRALLGSMERFIGVLLEHYAGSLPLWLSPEQIWIVPIGSHHKKYAQKIKKELSSFRVELKDENETISKKIREGEIQKIPYILVVGDKEIKTNSVSVRERGKKEIEIMKISKFLKKIKIEIEKYK